MSKERKIKDFLRKLATYVASSISIIILLMVFVFMFNQGKKSLSLDMFKNDYWSKNYLVSVDNNENIIFENEQPLKSGQAFSKKYGIILEDIINHEKEKQVSVAYVNENSPFNKTEILTAGKSENQALAISENNLIEKIVLFNEDNEETKVGMVYSDSANQIVKALDNSVAIKSIYFKTAGGGILGSLIATFKLIGISLLIALPLGVFTAIYLNEIINKNKIAKIIEYSIELLAGVPSIVFGLMGVVVLYPITTIFNIDGLSILLGGLTMSIILLPVVIRSTQESLKTVPNGLRMASLSLGANASQTIFKVVLPSALKGILSGLLLATSRIIGESAALIYTMGTFINDKPQINDKATTLAVHIWTIMNQEQPNFELAAAISIIILIMVLTLNLSVKFVSKRLNRKLGS